MIVALSLILFLLIAAIVVDLGTARQQKREEVSATDAGALAGAQALYASVQTPQGCPDAICAAAYYTLASIDLTPKGVALFAANRSP